MGPTFFYFNGNRSLIVYLRETVGLIYKLCCQFFHKMPTLFGQMARGKISILKVGHLKE